MLNKYLLNMSVLPPHPLLPPSLPYPTPPPTYSPSCWFWPSLLFTVTAEKPKEDSEQERKCSSGKLSEAGEASPEKVMVTHSVQAKENSAVRITGTEERHLFPKLPAHRTLLVPSGCHRCLVTAEICLAEAETGEYFWPN